MIGSDSRRSNNSRSSTTISDRSTSLKLDTIVSYFVEDIV
jgi:hypothetical protein